MILDLIGLLVLGIVCYWVNYIIMVTTSRKSRNKRKLQAKQKKERSKSQIKKDLDNLLAEYNQGIISEQQYYNRANPLIDKLSDLYADLAWTYETNTNAY